MAKWYILGIRFLEGNTMRHTAKIFVNGRSQAVRLPVEFRFDCSEVFVRRDPSNGDIILSRKLNTWDDVFTCLDALDIPSDVLEDCDQPPRQARPAL